MYEVTSLLPAAGSCGYAYPCFDMRTGGVGGNTPRIKQHINEWGPSREGSRYIVSGGRHVFLLLSRGRFANGIGIAGYLWGLWYGI